VRARDILREIRRHMPFRQTIAAKIFGLAIILLLLTIALAGFLLYEVTRTKQDLTVVANFRRAAYSISGTVARVRRNPPGKDWNGVWHLREK
jgi:cytochrome b561